MFRIRPAGMLQRLLFTCPAALKQAIAAATGFVVVFCGITIRAADAPLTLRRVWSRADIPGSWAVSPNGKWIAFRAPDNGIVVRDLGTGKNQSLRPADDVAIYGLVWSRDSSQVAYGYKQANSNGIRAADITGGRTREVLTETGVDLQSVFYTPVGYLVNDQDLIVQVFRPAAVEFAVVSIQSGKSHVIKSLQASPEIRINRAILSPKGDYIALARGPAGGAKDIFAIRLATGLETRIVEHIADDYPVAFTADGGRLIFASDRAKTLDLWTVPLRDGLPIGVPDRIRKDLLPPLTGDVTRDGVFYFSIGRTSLTDVFTADFDAKTGKVSSVPVPAVERYTGMNSGPDWSPDGERLIVQIGQPNDPNGVNLLTRNMATGEETLLHPQLFMFSRLRFSVDGRTVVAQGRRERGDEIAIFEIDLETGTPRALVTGGIVINPVWSRDGTRLFYERDGDSVQMLDRSTGRTSEIYKAPKKCLDGELTNFNSAPSPDGRSVAIQDCSSLYVVGVESGERKNVLVLREPDRFLFPGSLAWTPDGRWLLFAKFTGERAELCRVSPQGGVPQSAGLMLENKNIYFLRPSPNGRKLAFSIGDFVLTANEIWTMENF